MDYKIPMAVFKHPLLSPVAKLLYSYMLAHRDGDTREETLMKIVGVSKPTLKKAREQLQRAGLIEVFRDRSVGRAQVNSYVLK